MPTEDKKWREAFSHVGELVSLASAIDYQLNHIVIEVLGLEKLVMLEPVVATLDPVRKIEIIRGRVKHINNENWKKPVFKYIELIERVNRCRNTICHSQLLQNDGGFIFSSPQAAKIFKGLRFEGVPTVDRLGVDGVVEAIEIAEKALGAGQNIIENYQHFQQVLKQKIKSNKDSK